MRSSAAPRRIGMITGQLFHTYWAMLAHGARTRAQEIGVTLVEPAVEFDDDTEGAIRDILGRGICVLIAARNVTLTRLDLAQRCEEAGVELVAADDERLVGRATTVLTDEVQGTELAAGLLVDGVGGRGPIVHICGERDNTRAKTFPRLLEAWPDVWIGHTCEAHWSVAEGRRAMRVALTACPDVRGVFAHNDDLAIGAAEAIEEAGLAGAVTIVGFDGTPAGLAALQQGRIAGTVFRNSAALGRAALDTAAAIADGRATRTSTLIPSQITTRATLADAMLDTMQIVPQLLQDLVQSARASRRLRDEIIETQRALISELSSPIIPLGDRVLLLPLVGTIDSARAALVIEALLAAVSRHRAAHVLIDITGVPVIDTSIANNLLRAASAVRLLGARVVLVGISPEIAQTIVQLGLSLEGLTTYSTLEVGLAQIKRAALQHAARRSS